MGHRYSNSGFVRARGLQIRGNFPGATERLKRWNRFSRWNCCKRKFVLRFFKPPLIPCSGLRGHFLVKGTDLYSEIVNVIPGRNLLVLNFAHHLPKPWTDRFANANSKHHVFIPTRFWFYPKSAIILTSTQTQIPETAHNNTEMSTIGHRL